MIPRVTAVGLRGAGERYGHPPAYQLSARARSIGLETPEQAWQEYRAQTGGGDGVRLNDSGICWSRGAHWVCCFCEHEFLSPGGARKHMGREGHPVLRWLERYREEVETYKARVW